MRMSVRRSVLCVIALIGAVLLGLAGLGAPAGAGTSADGNTQPRLAFAGKSFSLSSLGQVKHGKLSPRLQRLAQPSLRTASVKAQAAAVGLPSFGPGSLLHRAAGKKLLVYVRVSGSVADATKAIEDAGASIVDISRRYRVVTAAVAPGQLQALGRLSEVRSAWEALAPVRWASCPTGFDSEGDSQLSASTARSTYGVDGSGVTVGILSDSYDSLHGAAAGVAAGELPGTNNPCGYTTPVSVLQDETGGSDEGRAMLEIVHDLAPGASLDFATADTGIFGMAGSIRALRSAGTKVIADDVTYLDEPFFQKGPIDIAIDDVTSSGVSYFSSAGNSNLVVGGNNVGSYEAPDYRPTACPAALPGYYLSCHGFDPGGTDNSARYTVAAHGYFEVDLQWAEAWDAVSTDLDLFLVNDSGTILAFSDIDSPAFGEPVEVAYVDNTGSSAPVNVNVVIARYDAGTQMPRLKYVVLAGGTQSPVTYAEYNSSSGGNIVGPTIFGHNGGEHTISVAAVHYSDPTRQPEPYTSHGPVTYYFGPADGTTPADPLASPQVLSKPDLAATDCGHTSFFYGPSHQFCGTSAAAPHAAAVAALMQNGGASFTPAQVLAKLQATANPVGSSTPDVVGAGLVNALSALDLPHLSFSQSGYTVGEAGGSAAITVKRSGGLGSTASVQFATSNGTASAGSDYTAVNQAVSFGAGDTTKTVTVPITNDTVYKGDSTINLTLSSPSSGAGLGNPVTAALTIKEDDAEPVLAFSAASYTVSEGKPAAEITITRSANSSGAVSVKFATSDSTAKAGKDYTAVSQTVSFASGETSKKVSIPITDDKLIEPDETVSLALSNPSGATLGTPATATLTITNAPGKITARLTRKSFRSSQAGKVKLVYSFSPPSDKFAYVLTFKKNGSWVRVTKVSKSGNFSGSHTMTVKKLFGGKPIKAGKYRLMLSARANSKTLAFTVT